MLMKNAGEEISRLLSCMENVLLPSSCMPMTSCQASHFPTKPTLYFVIEAIDC